MQLWYFLTRPGFPVPCDQRHMVHEGFRLQEIELGYTCIRQSPTRAVAVRGFTSQQQIAVDRTGKSGQIWSY